MVAYTIKMSKAMKEAFKYIYYVENITHGLRRRDVLNASDEMRGG